MSNNLNMNKAKSVKNDEFYTFIEDIEKEISNYKEFVKNKIIYCNCDNPKKSKFWEYFYINFHDLNIKKLIATYINEPYSYKYEYDGNCVNTYKLNDNGSFDSDECIDILKQSDIVITNPPFSLFRKYIDMLYEYNKSFIIIGNKNSATNGNIFNYFMYKNLHFGYNSVKLFVQPDNSIKKFGNIGWYTNINCLNYNKRLILTETYYDSNNNPKTDKYQKYDNYDAINVDRIKDIPCDYYGVMGVPITFLDYYPCSQLDMLGVNRKLCVREGNGEGGVGLNTNMIGFLSDEFKLIGIDRYYCPKECLVEGRLTVNHNMKYARMLIQRRCNYGKTRVV